MNASADGERIAVVGAGVIGLTSGIRLLEAGYGVALFARELPPGTTSDVAAAFWYPGGVGSERSTGWCRESLRAFRELANEGAAGAIRFVTLHELADEPFVNLGLGLAGDVRPVARDAFPAPWGYGYSLTVARIDVPRYMPLLVARFRDLGGSIEVADVRDLAGLAGRFAMVVNCAGVGARKLARDSALHPVRGQVVRIRMPEGLPPDIIHIDSGTTLTYIVPREDDCILGGSSQVGDDDLRVDAELAASILERVAVFHPALERVEVLGHAVGLRPGRREVRLEPEPVAGGLVVHNYGHGSIGHTLAWG